MHEASARNLRTVERFLLAPPLAARFGAAVVAICDISARGARFRHDAPLETGKKGVLRVTMEGRPAPINLEAVVVWTQPDAGPTGKYLSGVRTYGTPDVVSGLIAQLQTSNRSNRIEELRAADRFFVAPALDARFGSDAARIENLSARGARVELRNEPTIGASFPLAFRVPDTTHDTVVSATVVWTAVKSIQGTGASTWHAGLLIATKTELMRLSIAQLCEAGRATLDTTSLSLKLKIMRARARQFAPAAGPAGAAVIPSDQLLLIQGVREELRLNPDEAMHWYRRARLIINDPATRSTAAVIADHPDALAVWEYLDRSVDPTLIGRAFKLG
ncbi:MAG TPA: PilZ domain-containing protein [Thermoanaerobaculia bacterium]|nr:PilZ domain-containing protein [Thermoanaerobaculia bacterium]